MTSKVIAIIDNGSGKRGGACDDCGTALRYEYHTDDGGRYGSCCVHAHIHRPDWITLKAARDAREFARRMAGFQRMYPIAKQRGQITYQYFHYDGSIGVDIARSGERGGDWLVETLLAEGWKRELYRTPEGWTMISSHSTRYILKAA